MTSTQLTENVREFQFIIETDETVPDINDFIIFHGLKYRVSMKVFDTDKGLILLTAKKYGNGHQTVIHKHR